MISTKALSGAKMLLWSAVLLLVGGLLLGLLFGSLGMAALSTPEPGYEVGRRSRLFSSTGVWYRTPCRTGPSL